MEVTGRQGKQLATINLTPAEGKALTADVDVLGKIKTSAGLKLDVVDKNLVAHVKLPGMKMAADLVIKPEDITALLKAVDGKVVKFLLNALVKKK